MPPAAIAAGIGLIAVGQMGNLYMQYQALEEQKDARKAYEERLEAATREAEINQAEFEQRLQEIDDNFDPYEMDEAFASLYDGVIRPLEVDFEENALQEIRNSFNVGVDGVTANSGAAAFAEQTARRDLSMKKATLRAQEREKAITRAYADYDRRINSLQLGANSKANLINTKIGAAQGLYGADSDVASATAAFGGAIAQAGNSIGGAAISGANAYNTNRFVNAYEMKSMTGGSTTMSPSQVERYVSGG